MKNILPVLAVIINSIFSFQFFRKHYRLKNQVKNHNYTHQSFKGIDKENERIFLILGLAFLVNALIIANFIL